MILEFRGMLLPRNLRMTSLCGKGFLRAWQLDFMSEYRKRESQVDVTPSLLTQHQMLPSIIKFCSVEVQHLRTAHIKWEGI